jgi:hypothetical protein
MIPLMIWNRRVVAAVGLALLSAVPARAQTTTTTQPPVDAGLGLRLLEAPTNRRDDPRAKRYIVDHVPAGTSFTRAIEVSNGTDRVATVALYAAAASLENGEFVPASGHASNELSGWITIDPPMVTIPIGGRAQARVTVRIPADATPGERYAVALAELPPPPGSGLVGLASRVGIRVYLSVGPGDEPPTDFALKTFQPISELGRPGVSIHSCNTGGRAIDLGGAIKLDNGPGGIAAGPFKSTQPSSVAPGDCEDLKILLDPKLPRGPWDATATLQSGTKEKTATARITFPAPGQKGSAVPAHAKGTSDEPLLAGGATILALLAGGLAAFAWLRRRGRNNKTPAAAT